MTAFLFAPGAGAPFASEWMQSFAARLGELGRVQGLDYPYMRAGRKTPDRLPQLIAAHRAAFEALRAEQTGPIFLAGKSMGSRVGCHLANELPSDAVAGLICFGYPLVGQNGKVRDEVLRGLRRRVLFVQGTRDTLCPLEHLERVLSELRTPHELMVIEGGDHSLRLTKSALTQQGRSQDQVDAAILERVRQFVAEHA